MFSSVSIEIPKYLGSSLEGVECHIFTRCEAPNGIHALIPGVVCDNITPSLAQVQYFLGMERCHAGIARKREAKVVNCMNKSTSLDPLDPRRVRLDPAILKRVRHRQMATFNGTVMPSRNSAINKRYWTRIQNWSKL